MLAIRRILFPTDFTPCADAALGWALLLAEEHGAELHMLHALVLHGADPRHPGHDFRGAEEEVRRRVAAAAAERLEATAGEHASREVTITTAQRRGIAAAPVILDAAEDEDVDLIAMGTHGRGLSRLLLGSVAAEVVRLAECPVLTVRGPGRDEEVRPAGAPDRILVPVDFSEHAATALRYGLGLAETYGAELHVLHVIEEAIYPEFYYPILASSLPTPPELRRRVESELRGWVGERTGSDGEVAVHVGSGRAPREIAALGEELDADLIVLSSHGRTGLERVLLGSVAEGVVRTARCPVLTVKAFGRSLLPD